MDNGVVFITGRLVRDPKFFGEGDKRRALFTVAFNRGRGERRRSTFVDCIAWSGYADLMKSFSKGSGISLQGDLETAGTPGKDSESKVPLLRVNVSCLSSVSAIQSNGESFDGGNNANNEGIDESVEIPF